MGKTFHKYRADSEVTEKLITSGKIFLATAHQLNDPFECSFEDIASDWIGERIKEGMQGALTGFALEAKRAISRGESFFGLPHEDIEAALGAIMSHGELERSYDAWQRFMKERRGYSPSDVRALFGKLDDQLTETGIFSMSIDPEQALMWAHYAENHQGICLGFSPAPNLKLADPDHCMPVIYSDELPRMEGDGLTTSISFAVDAQGIPYTSSLKIAFSDKTFRRIVTTKPTCWAYEQECRYIEPFGGLSDWPGLLTEITFGLRCSVDRRRHYVQLLEAHVPNGVQLFEIRKKKGTNAIERVSMNFVTSSRAPITQKKLPSDEPERLGVHEFASRMQQLIQQERYGDVIFQTSENLKNDPESPILLHLKATALGLAQRHAEALKCFRNLRDRFPNVAAGWYGMACAYESMDQLERVVPLLRKAADLEPNDPSIVLNLGIHLSHKEESLREWLQYLRQAENLGHRRARRLIDQIENSTESKGGKP
ncbi:MAG: DUF2971 domain-containing protein [Planctomycetota bacterium]